MKRTPKAPAVDVTTTTSTLDPRTLAAVRGGSLSCYFSKVVGEKQG